MRQRLTLLAPLVLPFLLTIVLLLFLRLAEQKQETWETRKLAGELRQDALTRVESIRSGQTFESHARRFNDRFRSRLVDLAFGRGKRAQPALREKNARLHPLFQRSFPREFILPDTLLYVFALTPEGKPELVKGPGLESRKGRLLTDLFGMLLASQRKLPTDREKARNRCLGVFGQYCPFDLLSESRQGQATRCTFNGRTSFLVWDTLYLGDRVFGGYFLLFPGRAASHYNALWKVVRGEASRRTFPAIPILVPLEQSPAGSRPWVGASWMPASLKTLLKSRTKWKNREEILPNAALTQIGDLFLFRDHLSLHSGFEVWIAYSEKSVRRTGKIPLSRWFAFASLLFWAIPVLAILQTGRPLPIRLKLWFPGFIGLLGALPLTALYLIGMMQIESTQIRDIQREKDGALAEFEQIDASTPIQCVRFDETCRTLFTDPVWADDLLTRTTAGIQQGVERADGFLLRAGIQTQYLLFYPFDGSIHAFVREGKRLVRTREGVMNFFSSVVALCVEAIEYPNLKIVGDNTNPVGQLISNWYRSSGYDSQNNPVRGMGGYNRRGSSFLAKLGGDHRLNYFDFLSRDGKPAGVVILVCATREMYSRRLARITRYLYTAGEPTRLTVLARNSARGFSAIFPAETHRTWMTRPGRRLRSLMETAVRSGSRQVQATPDTLFLAIPLREIPDFFLGAHISLAGLVAMGRWRVFLFRSLTILLATFLLVLGRTASRHLIEPLEEVESGLRKVAAGNLEVRVAMPREDELGDLTRSFDAMTVGLQRRQDLGRFVSGTLDAEVATGSAGETGLAERVGTILVSDLRGFTTLSEAYPPREIVRMLNRHLESMTDCIQANGGAVEQFIGDAVVAAFFDDAGGSGLRPALMAASDMRRMHGVIQAQRRDVGEFAYEIGVGIATGRILNGTLVSSGRLEHLLLGQPRRRAENLEGLSRQGKSTRIVLSSDEVEVARREGIPLVLGSPVQRDAFELAELLPPASGRSRT